MVKLLCIIALQALAFFPVYAQESTLQTLIADDGIPGIQVEYAKDGHIKTYNLGVARKRDSQYVTANTIFEAASLSKVVFAYTVLRLYDRRVISLDTPLLHYLGSYNRFNPADPRYEKITARMVLCHKTGLPNWGDDKGAPLLFTPDSCFSYSGEGYLFLQRVVEKLMHQSLNELVTTEVFTPLGMTNSSYHWEPRFDSTSAFGNSADAIKWRQDDNAAFSLLTNAHDYTLFLQAIMKGKGLQPATHKMMFETMSHGYWYNELRPEAAPHINWGLGVGLMQNESGNWIWHWGDKGASKCFFIANPDKQESLVYFTYNRYGLQIMPDVLTAFFGKQTWWPSKWLDYDFENPDEMRAFRMELKKKGYEHAGEIYKRYQLSENDINELGFMLMRSDRKKEAAELFKLNITLHPQSGNAYDSMAEVYEAMGEKALALSNFKQALLLNPKNEYAEKHIKQLEGTITP